MEVSIPSVPSIENGDAWHEPLFARRGCPVTAIDPWPPMLALRMARCPRCKDLFWVCRRCDHGQLYCGEDCSAVARQACLKRARRRYRNSSKGRLKHCRAERRRRRRCRLSHNSRRNIASVGDHGSRPNLECGTPSVRPSSNEQEPKGRKEASSHENTALEDIVENKRDVPRCARCGRAGAGVSLAATQGWWPRRGY